MIDKKYCIEQSNIINSIYNKYKSEYDRLNENAEELTSYFQYSKGGDVVQDGYYCPSLGIDLALSNANRGKLYKKITTKTRPSYCYQFNKENNLIKATHLKSDKNSLSHTFVVHDGETEIRLMFVQRQKSQKLEFCLEGIGLCYFENGTLMSYAYACICGLLLNGKLKFIFEHEFYTYENGHLSKCDVYQLGFSVSQMALDVANKRPSLSFNFDVDENGQLFLIKP